MTPPSGEPSTSAEHRRNAGTVASGRVALSAWFSHELSRIRTRLLLVNLTAVVVPIAGLEFARIYERQLLDGLERDMRNQAALVQTQVRHSLVAGEPLTQLGREAWLKSAALLTRTRIRILDETLNVLADSHRDGAPEGPEAPLGNSVANRLFEDALGSRSRLGGEVPLNQRTELLGALQGKLSTMTRIAAHPPRVYLFLAMPVVVASHTAAVVYVTRSTYPVLIELRRIRSGLTQVLIVALSLSFGLTLLLAWTLTRPIERLAKAAHQVAAGKMDVQIPVSGGGELTDLGEALQSMTCKLEARHRYITQFAADVAHEFKSPLTAIRGAAELLAEGAADDPAARARFLANIEQDAERLARLVSRLLELSRIEASDEPFQLVDIAGLVRRVVQRVEGPDANIEIVIKATRTFIMGRPLELETALYNLLDNALRYGRSQNPVRVTLEQPERTSELCIKVRDRGPGIAPEHLDKLFQRFFTTDATGEGTGLGLSIVASVATGHHGTVTVQSTPGEGTEFTLRLPLPAIKSHGANIRRGSHG